MVQFICQFELGAEFIKPLHVKSTIKLNSDINIGQQIMCQPDLAKTTPSQLFDQFVMFRNKISFYQLHHVGKT